MPTWKELEVDFRELRTALQYSRLDAQWGTSGEHWRLAGGHDPNVRRQFEALSRIAGEKLSEALQSSPPRVMKKCSPSQILYGDGTRGSGSSVETLSMPLLRKKSVRMAR